MTAALEIDSLQAWRPPTGTRVAFNEDHLPPWELLVVKSGEEGERWVGSYLESGCVEIRREIENAFAGLRTGRVAEGLAGLDAARQRIAELDAGRPELRDVLGRWYFTASAYHHYRAGDWQAARDDVGRAQEAVERAVGRHRFLLPFAPYCVEFLYLHARIERAARRWCAMRIWVDRIYALAAGEAPLCQGGDGRPIFFSEIDRHLLALPRLSEEERLFLAEVCDPGQRGRRLRQVARRAYYLQSIVIPYP